MLMLLGCGNSTIDLSDPDRGLVARWALDENQPGATVVDSSGHGHAGTPSASAPTPSADVPSDPAQDRRSLTFNGLDQLVEFGNPPGLQLTGEITIAAWINPAALDGKRSIVTHGYRWSPSQEVSLRMLDGFYQIASWDGVNHWAELAIPATDVGTWVHLCGVYDGNAFIIYRNGELGAASTDTIGAIAVDAPWAIGARASSVPPDAARFYLGLLDEVRIYDRALSAAEVRVLAHAR